MYIWTLNAEVEFSFTAEEAGVQGRVEPGGREPWHISLVHHHIFCNQICRYGLIFGLKWWTFNLVCHHNPQNADCWRSIKPADLWLKTPYESILASPGPMGPLVKTDSGTPPFTKDLALLCSKDTTPLSSITNNPTRTKLQFGKKTARIPSSNSLLRS